MTVGEGISTISRVSPEAFADVLADASEPVLLKGLVSDWPVVAAAHQSHAVLDSYLRQFYQGASVGVISGEAAMAGRFFYNENLTGFNFFCSMKLTNSSFSSSS